MLRKALIGLLLCATVVLVLLAALGFRTQHFLRLFEAPYAEALQAGTYLKEMSIAVDGRTISGKHTFKMTVRNPTPRPLILSGNWSEDKGYTISPAAVHIAVPPGETKSLPINLEVKQRDVEGRAVPVYSFKPPEFEGNWKWRPWRSEASQGAKPASPQPLEFKIERRLRVRLAFGAVNYAVLGGYLALMLMIGWFAGRRIKGTRGFFIADGKLNYVVVGLSILGTYLSALTMMALPGMSYGKHDWTYIVQLPCLLITAMVITGLVLPRYRAAGVVSIYEFLEQRIDVSVRVVAAISFIIFAIGRMGLVLYLPALAFSTVTGAPLWLCVVGMGIIITIYTAMGGIEAVIWTDAIQAVIFIFAAFLTLGFIFGDIGVDKFLDIGLQHNKFRVLAPGFDIREITTIWLILETIFQTIRIYGTQQDIAQRYMTTESTEKANRSVWIGTLAYIPLGFVFYFIGTALFVFYAANPDANLPSRPDTMYPYYIVSHLPMGLAGLVIAAIFAAAMSSIDSCMNSSSTVCIEDFWKRFSKAGHSDGEYLRKARFLTILWGALAIVMGLMFMEIHYAQIVWQKLMGISTNGILGLMALAFLPFRVNKWAALAGFVLSYACLFTLMGAGVTFLLWPVAGNLTCFFVALFLNPLFAHAGERD